MGNCCSSDNDTDPQAFSGTGHRLGSAGETTSNDTTTNQAGGKNKGEKLPEPKRDPTMTDAEREQQRAERLAAAEARQKKLGGGGSTPKKKKENKDAPLVGPNSEPLMRWTAG